MIQTAVPMEAVAEEAVVAVAEVVVEEEVAVVVVADAVVDKIDGYEENNLAFGFSFH